MTTSEDLFILIKSLSRHEKRYFKIFAGRHVVGEINSYVLLFEAINVQHTYDEAALLKKFSGQGFVSHISRAKNQLYNLVLKSLESFHYQKSMEMKIRSGLNQIEILYKRNLVDQSQKILKRIKKLAQKFESYDYLPQISRWELVLSKAITPKNFSAEIERIYEEGFSYLRAVETENEIMRQHDRYFALKMIHGDKLGVKARARIEQIMQHSLLSDEQQKVTFRSTLGFHFTWAYYHQFNQEREKYIEEYRRMVEYWESHPIQIKESPGEYFKALFLYVSAHDSTEYPEVERIKLRDISQTPGLHNSESARMFEMYSNMELIYCLNTFQFKKALNMIPEMEIGLKKYDGNISETNKVIIYYNITLCFYVMEEFKNCLPWVNAILDMESSDKAVDYHRITRIMYLAVQYELGNFQGKGGDDFFAASYRATVRFFKKTREQNDLEKLTLKAIRSLARAFTVREKIQAFKKFADSLNAPENQNIQTQTGYLEILCWAESRARNITIKEIFQSKLA